MSQLFTLPKQVAVNASGQPYANATATFYRAGTSTPLTVYSTPDLANPHSNPVVADAAGMFPAIWLDDLSVYQYRVVVHDANGALLMDESLSGSLATSSGNVVMDAPSSGNTLTVNQTGGLSAAGIQIASQPGVGNMASLYLSATGVRDYHLRAVTDDGSLILRDVSGGADRFNLTSSGVWNYYATTGNRAARFHGPASQWAGIDLVDGNTGNLAWSLLSGYPTTGFFSIYNPDIADAFKISATGSISVHDGVSTLYPIGYSDIPRVTSGFIPGKCSALSAGATINTSDLYTGKVFSIYNDTGSSITITQGAGVTLRLAGTASSGTRTLAARGFATFWCNSATEVIGTGAGLS